MDQYKEKLKDNPLVKAGILSKLTFWWLLPLMWKGHRKDLQTGDLFQIDDCDESSKLADKIEKCWEKEKVRAKAKGSKASYARAIFSCFGWRYLGIGCLAAIEECVLRIGQPIALGLLIRYFNEEPGFTEDWKGWLFATLIVLGSVFYIFTHHPFFWGIQRIGMQLRIGSCALLYRKALRLSQSSLGETTVGQMVNLLSNDVNRFDTSVVFINYLWVGPLQLLISSAILWYELGPSCMAGLILLILFVPLQSHMGKVFSKLRGATAIKTDNRVRVMNEIVNAMRVIKMYAWEMPFSQLVADARKLEIGVTMRTNYYRAVNMSLFFTSAKMVVFLALLTYVLTGNTLTAEKVFVTSALINNVRLTMTLFFPFGIAMGSETLISCKRLQAFFEMDERQDCNRVRRTDKVGSNEKKGVDLANVRAMWTSTTSDRDTLSDISASVKAGQLLAVIGPVGSGKSSLLHTVIAELPVSEGTITVKGKIAYAAQEPWIFSGSVKQNILFGQKFDIKKYGEVIKVCGLEADLKQLPCSDETLVGERGTALSGGQKARINLARAVYLDADIYLLDDPLSAVDAVVGRHLFRKCIKGHLKDKAVILVTHQLQYLKSADNILVLNDGQCEAMGSYHQLINSGVNFTALFKDDKDTAARVNAIKRMGSSLSRQGSLSRSGSFRLGNTNPLLSSSTLSLTDSMASQEPQELDDDIIKSTITDTKQVNGVKKELDSSLSLKPQTGEMRSVGTVSSKVYLKYFLNGGHWIVCVLLMVLNVVTQLLFTLSDWWLSYWTNGEQMKATAALSYNETNTSTPQMYDYGEDGYLDTETNVIIYSSLVGGLFLFSFGRTVLFFVVCMTSSRSLHNKMFSAVIRVPIKYFDTHPIGQILNRFTKDCGLIDEMLPVAVYDVLAIMLNLLAIIGMISYLNVWLLLPTVFLFGIFVYFRRFYLSTARDIKRLEGITRSPVFSHLSTSLQGLTTIRAFNAEQAFVSDFDNHQNTHSSAWFLFLCTTRWFGICLDWLSCLYIAIVTYSFMGMTNVLGGDIGLAISLAMNLSGMFQWGVRQSAEVENQMTSVERVLEFSKLTPEAPLETEKDKELDSTWPSKGDISFKDVYLKYEETSAPVLKQLNFDIRAGEKIGIVGRTGAGKSSLISCLFRLTEPEGAILIDGANITSLGLHKLRRNISIIPQDPTLFHTTLRKNLDPFAQYEDAALWHALEEVQLKDALSMGETSKGLYTSISEGGANLSVGQRQLVCLARAILSHNPILLMDEATANVDPKTDALIQKTIREKFVSCTVLTVAHRLHTIMDSDRVMVLSQGCLKEMDAPHLLLKDKNSIFSELVQQTGPATSKQLKNLAANSYNKKEVQENADVVVQQNNSEDANKNTIGDASKNNPEDVVKQDNPEDASKNNPEDASKNNPEDASKNNPEDASKNNPEDVVKQDNQENASKNSPEDVVKQDSPEDVVNQDSPEDAIKNTSGDSSRNNEDVLSSGQSQEGSAIRYIDEKDEADQEGVTSSASTEEDLNRLSQNDGEINTKL